MSVGSSKAHLTQVAHGKPVSLGMAFAIAATANAEGSDVRVDDFLLTADGRKHYSAAVSALRRLRRDKARRQSPQQLPAGDCLADFLGQQIAQQGAVATQQGAAN